MRQNILQGLLEDTDYIWLLCYFWLYCCSYQVAVNEQAMLAFPSVFCTCGRMSLTLTSWGKWGFQMSRPDGFLVLVLLMFWQDDQEIWSCKVTSLGTVHRTTSSWKQRTAAEKEVWYLGISRSSCSFFLNIYFLKSVGCLTTGPLKSAKRRQVHVKDGDDVVGSVVHCSFVRLDLQKAILHKEFEVW